MDRETISSYNQSAAEYETKTADYWSRFPNEFLHAFIRQARGKVLDAGSGPGRDASIFTYHGLKVTCLDASVEMVKRCQDKGLEAVVGDISALPFAEATFDAVWSYTSLLHVPRNDCAHALKEIWRVLKPGGTFGLGLIAGTGEGYTASFKSETRPTQRWFTYFSEQEAAALLSDAEFTVTQYPSIIDPRTHRQYIHLLCTK